jgi:hypothetical protein
MPRRDTLTRRRGPGGRPTALTDRTETVIIGAIRSGNHINTACHLAGVTTTSFYRWMAKADALDLAIETGQPYDRDDLRFREFRDSVLRARAEAAETMIDVVHRAAVGGQLISEEPALDGSGNPIRDDNGSVIMKRQWTQPDGRLALSYLKVAQPGEWSGAPSRLEVSGPGGAALGAAGGDEPTGDEVNRLATRLQQAVAARKQEAIEAARHGEPDDDDDVYDAEVVE